VENENTHYKNCNMESNTEKMWKMRTAQCRTWNMAIDLENEKKNEELTR
jgi:hypothetical protein